MAGFLKLSGFRCGYPKKFVLNEVGFEVNKGSFIGVIGPNGSGKTTLFKGICGDLPILTGQMFLHGQNIQSLKIRDRAKQIAVVTQHIEVTDMTVEDFVLLGRLPYRKKFQFFETERDYMIVEKYMKLTDIIHLRHKYISQLSGGEQQLAAIARALSQEPELLLLDEPTSHLDITHQVQILNLIQHLNAEMNLTVLMIIHDLNLAGEYCDYLLMMQKGQLFKQGEPMDVLTYENIEKVYNTVVITRTNPISQKPVVFLVSERVLKNVNEEKGQNLTKRDHS